MVDISQLTGLISALRAETEADSVSPERVGYVLQKITEALPDCEVIVNVVRGWVPIASTDNLPETPTAEDRGKVYLLGTVLYVYVGTGGDTLGGKYLSAELKGPQGNPGTQLGETEIVDDLDSDDPDKVLSAKQGKRLKGFVDDLELAVSKELLDGTTYIGKALKQDPSSERGAVVDSAPMKIEVFDNLVAGDKLIVSYIGSDNTSGARAAAWHTTTDVGVMSHATYVAVTGIPAYTKQAAGNTYEITVPDNVACLVVCMAANLVRAEVYHAGTNGKRIDNIEKAITELETSVDENLTVYEQKLLSSSVENILAEYRIELSSYNILQSSLQSTYSVHAYPVTSGEKLRIVNSSTSQSSVTAVYAFYSDESLLDGDGNLLPSGSTHIVIDPQYVHNWGQTSPIFDDTLVVPDGANLLVVTHLVKNLSNPKVYKFVGTSVVEAIEELRTETQQNERDLLNVVRNGDIVQAAYNDGKGHETLYIFNTIYTNANNGWGLRSVNVRDVERDYPSVAGESGDGQLVSIANQTGSDMIGPIALQVPSYVEKTSGGVTTYDIGSSTWCGGAHPIILTDHVKTPSLRNITKTIKADGVELISGANVLASEVEITVEQDVFGPNAAIDGLVHLLHETITMVLSKDKMRVSVVHDYTNTDSYFVGKTIGTYYGMQSNGFGSRSTASVMTCLGKWPVFVVEDSVIGTNTQGNPVTDKGFNKGDYPNFKHFVQRLASGWCQGLHLNSEIGLGDHHLLGSSDSIFVDGFTGKYYHKLIANYVIAAGMRYVWAGEYRWWHTDNEDEVYATIDFGGGGSNINAQNDKRTYVDNSADASVELSVATYNDLGTLSAWKPVTLPAAYNRGDEFVFRFECNDADLSPVLPAGVVLADGFDFSEMAVGVTYQVSIMDGVAAYLCITPNS